MIQRCHCSSIFAGYSAGSFLLGHMSSFAGVNPSFKHIMHNKIYLYNISIIFKICTYQKRDYRWYYFQHLKINSSQNHKSFYFQVRQSYFVCNQQLNKNIISAATILFLQVAPINSAFQHFFKTELLDFICWKRTSILVRNCFQWRNYF